MADTSKRGFASMNKERQREIASKGGRAAHEKGTAHEFTSDEARQAGRKGGESVSRNRDHMASIGRKGGESRSANRSKDSVSRPAFGSTSSERSSNSEGGTNNLNPRSAGPARSDDMMSESGERR